MKPNLEEIIPEEVFGWWASEIVEQEFNGNVHSLGEELSKYFEGEIKITGEELW